MTPPNPTNGMRYVTWPQFLVAIGTASTLVAGGILMTWHQRDATLSQLEKRMDDNFRMGAQDRIRLETKIDHLAQDLKAMKK